jgi:hypothetical protein
MGKQVVAEMTPGHAGNDCTASGKMRPFGYNRGMETQQPFAEWAPLLALCRDGLRVLPRGWREAGVDFRIDGNRKEMFYHITDGYRSEAYTFGSRDMTATEQEQKFMVARWFAKVVRQIEGESAVVQR